VSDEERLRYRLDGDVQAPENVIGACTRDIGPGIVTKPAPSPKA
jgi:hypothetical protein